MTGEDPHDDRERPDSGEDPSDDRKRPDSGDESAASGATGSGDGPGAGTSTDSERVRQLARELAATREDLDALESRVEDRTVHRDDIRAELKRYVRARQRRGHATGWGPYLVLLYGTVMTLGAFYYLGGAWAVAAMLVVWLSTLGLYVFTVVAGAALGVGRKLAGLRELVGRLR